MANSLGSRAISSPPRVTRRWAVSRVRSPTVRVLVRWPTCLRVMARMRANSSSKEKGLMR